MSVTSRYFIAAGFVLAVGFSCEPTQEEIFSEQPAIKIDLEAIRKRGYINALVDNNSISYFIYKGKPMGYEYELLQQLAQHLDVKLKIKVTTGVEHAISQLNRGEGDILAFPLTASKARKQWIDFTSPHFNTYQVLVQRKPEGWQKLTQEQIQARLLRTPSQLAQKEVHVLKGTSHELRLHNLSEEIGSDILIRTDSLNEASEALIRKVSTGEIDYTVADHTMAYVNAAYYPNLDVSTILSVPQPIGWGVRKNSPELLKVIDDWLLKVKKEPTFMVIYNRYFKSPRTSVGRMKSDYFSFGGNQLSPYDNLIKQGADKLGWDWRLLASVVYQESRFNPQGESWAGAKGLMQLMPETAKRFGVENINDPRQSIRAGVSYLHYLERYWTASVPDSVERLKFVLASYNAGLSHIQDAKKLTEKYNDDPTRWDGHVASYLLKKTHPQYYRDPLVSAGYCKCEEPVRYVSEVLDRFEEYRMHIRRDVTDSPGLRNPISAR